jgi:biopolymer transport protein ExbD
LLTRSRRHRERLAPNADINLINLVDLAFVLLIIFIVTAPMLQAGINVALPRADAAPVPASDDGVIVSVDPKGDIYVGDVRMKSIDELEQMLPSYLSRQNKKEVYLRGDNSITYGRVTQVLGRLKKLNVSEVHLMVNPETDK